MLLLLSSGTNIVFNDKNKKFNRHAILCLINLC
jgi:hypothetical protein